MTHLVLTWMLRFLEPTNDVASTAFLSTRDPQFLNIINAALLSQGIPVTWSRGEAFELSLPPELRDDASALVTIDVSLQRPLLKTPHGASASLCMTDLDADLYTESMLMCSEAQLR